MGELPLKGHHDLPAELQEQEGGNWGNIEFQKVRLLKYELCN